ncbi:MAG: isoprenylcysteine carboxylmethyltransferase family protein [Chloroflexi bacterium]|nr:isoprenylcysteine carboxylmethyltransferase family protein [Chloroflexota bacterium]
MRIFVVMFWAAIAAEIAIRAPINQQRKKQPKPEQHVSLQEKILLGLLFISGFLAPLIYSATSWLNFADYSLPAWAGWLGTTLILLAILVFWRGHADLGLNWSPTLEIRTEHKLITTGIYGVIRHPMYASQWLWVFAQSLLLQNWIAGFFSIAVWMLFYFLRVQAEEKMMLDTFGEEYREYIKRTGAVLPKIG